MLSFPTYRSKRRVVQTLSTVVIIVLPFLNILRLDIPTLRFYFLNSVLWVDEFYLLFLVVMLILWIIVIFSMMYGRVWCGWMCPQTVLNELAWWFEKRAKRWLRVPRLPGCQTRSTTSFRQAAIGLVAGGQARNGGSLLRRVSAHALVSTAVAAVSLLIGFNLVAYFVDPYRMLTEIAQWSLGPVTTGIIIGIALLVLVDVLFWREKFCTMACPYGMMQMVVTDAHTQIVRYQTARDSECIDCKACVRDCMMGINIRTSPYQTECIHCGDCVDSCSAILLRLKKPLPTLISFSWGEHQVPNTTWRQKLGFVDTKRWIVLGLTAAYALSLVAVIQLRQPLSLSVSGDRSRLFRFGDDGRIYNDYVMKMSNRSLDDSIIRIECGNEHTKILGCSLHTEEIPIPLKSQEVRTLRLSISTSGANLKPGPNRLELAAVNTANPAVRAKAAIVFFMPENGTPQFSSIPGHN